MAPIKVRVLNILIYTSMRRDRNRSCCAIAYLLKLNGECHWTSASVELEECEVTRRSDCALRARITRLTGSPFMRDCGAHLLVCWCALPAARSAPDVAKSTNTHVPDQRSLDSRIEWHGCAVGRGRFWIFVME
jgi:hypothetical protein